MPAWLVGLNNVKEVCLALAAIGACLLGVWHYVLKPTKKLIEVCIAAVKRVIKVYESIGDNGDETLFEIVHRIDQRQNEFDVWRVTVDNSMKAQDITLDALLERE